MSTTAKQSLEIPLLHRIAEEWGKTPVQVMAIWLQNYSRLQQGKMDHVFDYLRVEAEGQIPRLEALGINTDDQFFEQSINSVITLATRLKAENEDLRRRLKEKQDWICAMCIYEEVKRRNSDKSKNTNQ